MLKEYIAYLQYNPKGYWFKRKLFGWGWTPARWHGWAALGAYVLSLYVLFIKIDANSHSGSDTLFGFVVPLLVSTSILVVLCYVKGEKPTWQWGIPKKEKDSDS